MELTNSRSGKGVGASREMASSIPRRNVRIRMRTLTSQASHSRSSNMDCMPNPISSVETENAWGGVRGRVIVLRQSYSRPQLFVLSRQFGNHREQWHVQRNHDASDGHTQE